VTGVTQRVRGAAPRDYTGAFPAAGGPLPSLFTRIIRGELPGRFVWRDERAVAFLSIAPLKPGHTLVVPVEEIDHWLDVPPELMAHLTRVAQQIGQAMQHAFGPEKVGLMIAGLEVRHVHLHLVPIHTLGDLDFAKADTNASPAALDAAAARLRAALRAAGHREVAEK
jgi:histidine triad (HIT) family protein